MTENETLKGEIAETKENENVIDEPTEAPAEPVELAKPLDENGRLNLKRGRAKYDDGEDDQDEDDQDDDEEEEEEEDDDDEDFDEDDDAEDEEDDLSEEEVPQERSRRARKPVDYKRALAEMQAEAKARGETLEEDEAE